MATLGPPSADIPRFTVDGEQQTIVDWYRMLETGDCDRLVHATSAYHVNSDNERATYALAFLYRGVAYACLGRWRDGAVDLERATICREDLTSIGNSDQEHPLKLLSWAVRYVEGNGEHVGGRHPDVSCGPPETTEPPMPYDSGSLGPTTPAA
jgi:hypothetical protein